jgi:hypothetical protein
MFWNYRFRLNYWRFDRAVRAILDTPPMPVIRPERCTIVSMIARRDLRMYIVAMKAFYRRVGGGRIVAMLDGPRAPAELDLVSRHFPGIVFEQVADVPVGACQRGGTWERLVYLLDLADRGEYAVQMDCDIMPTGEDIAELVRCIETRTAFTMADHAKIVPVSQSAEFARGIVGDYIGNVAERVMDRLPGAETLRYVRGSSGLAGFAPGGFPRARIEWFHREMAKLVGEQRWREWGTEQCGSNFAVANTPEAITLPYPQYASFHPFGDRDDAKLYHFIGSFRFREGAFVRLARQEIAVLRSGGQRPGTG